MLNQLFPNPDVLKRLTASSLGSLIQSYAMSHAGKLSPSTMQHRIRAAAHFGYWLDTQHIGINNVDFGEAIIFARIGDATSSSSNQQWRGLRGIWGFCTTRRKMT
ncbi:hypothetical protein AB2X50_002438 [Salmonella enterica]